MSTSPIKLKDAVVVITGAARGIGLATAHQFTAAGANVVIGDLDHDVAPTAAQKVCRVPGSVEALNWRADGSRLGVVPVVVVFELDGWDEPDGSVPARASNARWLTGTSLRAQLLALRKKYVHGLCRTAYRPLLVTWQLRVIESA